MFDAVGKIGQPRPFIGDIGGLAGDVVRELSQQALDKHQAAVGFIFQNSQLAVIFIDGARQSIGGAGGVQQEFRHARIFGHLVAQAVQCGNIRTQPVQIRLGGVPLIDHDRIARRGAELQACGDGGDGAVIALRIACGKRAQFLQARIMLADAAVEVL